MYLQQHVMTKDKTILIYLQQDVMTKEKIMTNIRI